MKAYYCSAFRCRGGTTFRCTKCHYVEYCSSACHLRDWDQFHGKLCPHYQRIGSGKEDDPLAVLMVTEMLYARATWYRALETDENVCLFAKGCFQTGSVIKHVHTGRLLTMDIFLQELTDEERRLTMMSIAYRRIAQMQPNKRKIRITLSKTPLVCHRCNNHCGDLYGLIPDRNFGGFLYLCIECNRENVVTVDLHQVPWKEISSISRESFPVWLQDALPITSSSSSR